MKQPHCSCVLALALLTVLAGHVDSVHGQGTVNFNNLLGPAGSRDVDARIYHTDCETPLSGADFLAGLYAGSVGALEPELVFVGPPAAFRTGLGAGYFASADVGTRVIPFLPPGVNATVQVRVWEASAGSYEAARAGAGLYGASDLLTIIALPNGFGGPPAALVGLQSFCLIPEPSPALLLIAGACFWGGQSIWRKRREKVLYQP